MCKFRSPFARGCTAPQLMPDRPGTLGAMSQQDKAEPTAPDPTGLTPGARGTNGWNDWVRRNFSAQRLFRSRPPSRAVAAATPDDGLFPAQRAAAAKKAVNTLDGREQRIGFFAFVFEVALTAIIAIPYLTHHVKPKNDTLKTIAAVHDFALEGIVVALFLLLGTLLKRRALLGFGSLAAGIWLAELPSLPRFRPCLPRPWDVAVVEGTQVSTRRARCPSGRRQPTKAGQGVSRRRQVGRQPRRTKAEQALHATEAVAPSPHEEAGAGSSGAPQVVTRTATVPDSTSRQVPGRFYR